MGSVWTLPLHDAYGRTSTDVGRRRRRSSAQPLQADDPHPIQRVVASCCWDTFRGRSCPVLKRRGGRERQMRYQRVVKLEEDVAAELASVLLAVCGSTANPLIGWAWSQADYRASPTRAFFGKGGALTVADHGMPALERAMGALLADQRARASWQEEDLWTTVLSLLAAASTDSSLDLDAAVRRLLKPPAVRIAAALANVTWEAEPASLGVLMIAGLQTQEDAASVASRLGLDARHREAFLAHSRQLLAAFGSFVVATATSKRQGNLAFEDFNVMLEDVFGLVLLFSDRLDEHGVYSLRGATNRPGVRGISLDRNALGDLLAETGAAELAARVLTISGWNVGNSFHWLSAGPVPLDRLLDTDLLPLVVDLLTAEDAIAQRLRVAARWYARAFWADAEEDAALAVSVALDSLLTGRDAVPGAVSKGRFALLERDPAARATRFQRYEEVYKVRCAVAHGGDAAHSLARIGGARSMLEDARWTARQLIALRRISTAKDDAAFRDLWAAVQWGTLQWTDSPSH